MDLKFEDIEISHVTGLNSAEVITIVNKCGDLPLDKALKFNYKDTEDFKKLIPDFTGFKATLADALRNEYHKKRKFGIKSNRSTGEIQIHLLKIY